MKTLSTEQLPTVSGGYKLSWTPDEEAFLESILEKSSAIFIENPENQLSNGPVVSAILKLEALIQAADESPCYLEIGSPYHLYCQP